MPKENESKSKQDKKRQNYLESAMIMNRLLDSRYFPDVLAALKKKEQGKTDFKNLCKDLKIPDGMIDTLWNTLLGVDNKMADEPGWIGR
jgi:hypothetical protein